MLVAALLVNIAVAGPIDDQCSTVPANQTVGPLGWGSEKVVDSGPDRYGSSTCPGTWIVDVEINPRGSLATEISFMDLGKLPTTQEDCERLVVTARAWAGVWDGSWLKVPGSEQRKTGEWTGDRCSAPVVFPTVDFAGSFRIAARVGTLNAKGREVPARVSLTLRPNAPVTEDPEVSGATP